MTNQEAINRLMEISSILEDLSFDKDNSGALKNYKVSIQTAVIALEKQIPMKPKNRIKINFDFACGLCSKCSEGINEQMRFCSDCGQSIDWREDV